jgi:glycosyltransferase involved in cell wall biosynthesis
VVQVLHLPPAPDVAEAVRRTADARVAVITVSEAMRSAWAGVGVEARVIRNGVPVERIPWRRRGAGAGALFAGRLSPEKGALDALEIAGRARVPLTIVGPPYDEPHSVEIRRRAAGAGATVLDPVPRNRLWALMAAAAAVLCPVRWEEPFGLVAAEAQATGTPVVGYRRGALGEVVVDGVTGALVAEGDAAAAAAALAEAGSFDRGAVRRHAERDLALDDMVDGYEELSLELELGVVPSRRGS